MNPAAPKASTQALTAGNWWLVGTSSLLPVGATGAQIDFSGPLTVSGDGVSVTTTASTSPCFVAKPAVISGPASGGHVTLTSPASASPASFVLTVQGTTENSTLLDGTYQLAGGTNVGKCTADVGTVFGKYVPPLSGTFAGSVTESDPNANNANPLPPNVASLSISLSQGSTPATFATPGGFTVSAFPLSGTVTWNNATCYGGGVIDASQSYIEGQNAVIAVTNASGGYSSYSFGQVVVFSPGSATTGFKVNLMPQGGPCDGYVVTGTVTNS